MAGTMVHLMIADILAQEWTGKEIITPYGSTRVEYDYFVAGNICPDGIMARKGYVREMKKHTHFRDGIPDGDFHKEEIKGLTNLWKTVLTALKLTMNGVFILGTGCICWQMKCLLWRYVLNF